jgi:hypothetical protein
MSDKQDKRFGSATGQSKGAAGQAGGAGSVQQGHEAVQRGVEQMRSAAEASAKLSQEMIERATQNFEVMRRIGETLGSGARSAAEDLSEYVRHTAQRQQEMAQRLAQARTPNDVLEVQTRYFQDNLRELLGLSERLSQTSAETARQAGQKLGGGDEGPARS